MRILSIDPGYERIGIAVLEKTSQKKEEIIFSECFKTSSKLPHAERLALIGARLEEIIKKYKPGALATEKLFFAANQKTALSVAEARGIILYEGARHHLAIHEYMPMQIKIAVTGYGKADKKQVAFMVRKLVSVDEKIHSDDEIDAIAIGLTCLASEKFQGTA